MTPAQSCCVVSPALIHLHPPTGRPCRPLQLIVWAFDLLPATVPRTYPALGRAAAGRHGLRAVMLFSFLELFGGSCILLMVAWRMAELLLPPGERIPHSKTWLC